MSVQCAPRGNQPVRLSTSVEVPPLREHVSAASAVTAVDVGGDSPAAAPGESGEPQMAGATRQPKAAEAAASAAAAEKEAGAVGAGAATTWASTKTVKLLVAIAGIYFF